MIQALITAATSSGDIVTVAVQWQDDQDLGLSFGASSFAYKAAAFDPAQLDADIQKTGQDIANDPETAKRIEGGVSRKMLDPLIGQIIPIK